MDVSQLGDSDLVSLAKDRHQGAQQTLYRRYVPRIFGYFMSQMHNVHTAEDLTQETFIRAFNAMQGFRGDASFKNWLYRIAKNQLADFYRDKHAYVNELNEALPPRQLQSSIVDAETVKHEERNTMRRLGRIMFHLPQRYKEVLVLRFLKGFSLKETAAAMRLTLSNIKILQHRALKLARQKSGIE